MLRDQIFSGILKTVRVARLNPLNKRLTQEQREDSFEEKKKAIRSQDGELLDKVAKNYYACPK